MGGVHLYACVQVKGAVCEVTCKRMPAFINHSAHFSEKSSRVSVRTSTVPPPLAVEAAEQLVIADRRKLPEACSFLH